LTNSSITCAAAKLVKKAAYQQVLHHLESNNLMDPFQSGFRPNHSTTTALLQVGDDIRAATDKGMLTFLVLFDFTQAFPSIIHEILFLKMYALGFSKPTVDWLKSFLR